MNNEARFGITFGVKGVKQFQQAVNVINTRMSKLRDTIDKIGAKLNKTGQIARDTGNKQNKTLDDGKKKANQLSKELDRLAKKWLSIGGAIALVSAIVRKTFGRASEINGITRMAQSAGVAEARINGLGRALKNYGGDASSAASAYTSLNDILGGARAGKGIGDEVAIASARYGIALNGGMLTEDQLMTNIARAMQAQRKQGNMYAVRDIASAFGIDEAMMLHLSEKGASWDKGIPKNGKMSAQDSAKKMQDLMNRFDVLIKQLIDNVLPLVVKAMEGILAVVEWVKKTFFGDKKAKLIALRDGTYDQKIQEARDKATINPLTGKPYSETPSQPTTKTPRNIEIDPTVYGKLAAQKLASARDYANYYNTTSGVDISAGLRNIQEILSGVAGTSASLVNDQGKLKIIIEDKAGVLRNMDVYGQFGNSSNIAMATKG